MPLNLKRWFLFRIRKGKTVYSKAEQCGYSSCNYEVLRRLRKRKGRKELSKFMKKLLALNFLIFELMTISFVVK